MLLYRVLSFFWSNNRLILSAYIFGSFCLIGFFFFRHGNLQPDFNSLSLLRSLNIIFFMFATMLCREILYKFYTNKSHYFFAQLPVAPIKMRLYEHFSWFVLVVLPYLFLIPLLLCHVYYAGLWSTQQISGFLGFQLILWFCFANYALCLAMMGRLCWYVFWGVLIGLNIYIRYSKNYDYDFLSFFEVHRVLYQKDPLTLSFILRYVGLTVLLYSGAFILISSIDRNAFGFLHKKETGLSRGIFMLFVLVLVSVNFYYVEQFDLSKTKFSGLHLTQLGQRPDDFWSSAVQLNDQQRENYAVPINQLGHELLEFAAFYQIHLPAIHLQHNPDQEFLMPLYEDVDADSAIEVSFNFEQLNDDFQAIERDAIIETLILISRGWLEKEDKLIYLRGLAANWSWRNDEKALNKQRLRFLATYPNFEQYLKNAHWQRLFQNTGACLFDTFAASMVQEMSLTSTADQWQDYILNGLNLDHSWVPFHVFRSSLSWVSNAEQLVANLTMKSLLETPTLQATHLHYSLETKQIYPQVFQLILHASAITESHTAIQVHLYQHKKPGKLVDFQAMRSEFLNKKQLDDGYLPSLLMLKKDRFSSTFSWYDPNLACRIYAPWKYVEL